MKAPVYNSLNLFTGEHRPNPLFHALDQIDHDNALAEVDRQIAARQIARLIAERDALKSEIEALKRECEACVEEREQLLIELGYVKLATRSWIVDEGPDRRARRDRNRGNR